MSSDDKELLAKLEGNLKMTVFGQDDAVTQMVSAIKLARAGPRGGQKPIGSFLLAGPTGVGKTELTRELALQMGLELLRFDMSEYMEAHTVIAPDWPPPGYVGYDQGGQLTDAVRRNPHSVVLLGRGGESAPRRLQPAAAGNGPRHTH